MRYLEGQKENEAEEWMREAARAAEKALCLRAKCGTVIVKDGKIVGEGYNAPPLDNPKYRMCHVEFRLPQKFKYDRTCCLHAEWRAIIDGLKKNSDDLVGARLYFTRVDNNGRILRSGAPYCTECSRMALDSGIEEFVLWHDEGICVYPADEYNQLSYQYTEEEKE